MTRARRSTTVPPRRRGAPPGPVGGLRRTPFAIGGVVALLVVLVVVAGPAGARSAGGPVPAGESGAPGAAGAVGGEPTFAPPPEEAATKVLPADAVSGGDARGASVGATTGATTEATTEGPDWLPIVGTAQLWCTWDDNPGCSGHHTTPALDIGLAVGTPVYAAGGGTVIDSDTTCASGDSGCSFGRGRFVAIQHPDGRYSRYLHLDTVVVAGGPVARGQLIGYSGDTGSTSAPHLHYDELTDYTNTVRVDPGVMYAMWGSTTVAYPAAGGTASWTTLPFGTSLRNDGFDEPPSPPPPTPPANGAGFHAVVPFRALDSRLPTSPWGGFPVGAGQSRTLTVAGANGIPATASAVVMNVTVTEGTAQSYLTAYPAGAAVPNAANLVFEPGQTTPNLVTVAVGGAGGVRFFNAAGAVHLTVDVVGWFDDGTGAGDVFFWLPPFRALDSRGGTGGWAGTPLGAGQVRSLQLRGAGLLPAEADAVVLNLTATQGTDATYVQAFPSGSAQPVTANVLAAANQTVPNLVTVGLGADGAISLFNQRGAVHLVVDVVGWYGSGPAGGRFFPTNPTRLVDTRVGLGAPTPWGPGTTRPVVVADGVTVPTTATAVVANVTVALPTQPSYLSVYPAGLFAPGTANVLFGFAQTTQNQVVVGLSGGAATVLNQQGFVHVIADVAGYFAVG